MHTLTEEQRWGPLALTYINYRLKYQQVEPCSERARCVANEVAGMTEIPAHEIAQFLEAVLQNSIGRTFPMERAQKIAIAWCLANKKKVKSELGLDEEYEFHLIVNTARLMQVDGNEALAFNDFLSSIQTDT